MFKGGFGPGNMQNLMRQAQKLQAEMQEKNEKAEQELNETVLTASSGGGMVSCEISGKCKIKSLTINKDAVDPNDVEMLEDMVIACVNDAIDKVKELEKSLKPNLPGGLF
jgi:DNA-binding YbaB/EbfC family protein